MKSLIYNKTLFEPGLVGITNGNITIKEVDASVADPIIAAHHYSKKATPNRFASFVVNDGLGCMQLGFGIRPHLKHTISRFITPKNYCEFDRMWLSDDLPKNSESQCIGMLLTYIKRKYPNIIFVITYADGSVGNKGIIYKATNAITIGSIPVDFYMLESGERVHPVSMWHRHKTRAWSTMQSLYPNIRHITKERQYRFLYVLHHGFRKKFVNELCGIGIEGDTDCNQQSGDGSTPSFRL